MSDISEDDLVLPINKKRKTNKTEEITQVNEKPKEVLEEPIESFNIVVKHNNKEKIHSIKENDTLENIYRVYCETEGKKIKFKNVFISKFSTLKRIGFDPKKDFLEVVDTNIPVKEQESYNVNNIKLKINYDHGKQHEIIISKECKLEDILKIYKEINLSNYNKIILNGYSIGLEKYIKDVLEDDDVIDVIFE